MKFLLSLLTILTVTTAFAQLKNPSFERWTTIFNYENPDEWKTANGVLALVPGNTLFTVKKSTTASDSMYSALLHTQFIGATGEDIPGVLSTADIGVDFVTFEPLFTGGLPFTGRPIKIIADYMYHPSMNDTCGAQLYLTRWDANNSKRDTIGVASFQQKDSVKTWTSLELNIDYWTNDEPDTLILYYTSSISIASSADGSKMYIDKVQVEWQTGIQSPLFQKEKAIIYPNPASHSLYVVSPQNENRYHITIYNILGKKIRDIDLHEGKNRIDVQNWNMGIYLFEVRDSDNYVVQAGKFTKN